MKIRRVLVTTLGHVDHGKSSLLDKIRGTTIVEREAGKITQAIGASIIPIETIKRVCGKLLDGIKQKITIPGILAIDTPGHEAFTSLRKRGGNLADIAIVVVDIKEGFKPQTYEAIEILKESKTPFVIAANKIDLIPGWQSNKGTQRETLLDTINKQSMNVIKELEKGIYNIVAKLAELGFNSERFDRVEDYTKQVAIIPLSAKTGEGIAELLMVITGLAQKYLEKHLEYNVKGFAKGTVLEVKETKGFGITIDVILYDGKLKLNDIIVIGGLEKPVVTKVKALLEPKPLAEMMDKKSKYNCVEEVVAATGVKIAANELDKVIAGMPLLSCDEKGIEKAKEEVQKEVGQVIINTDKEGVVAKADSIGGLEALIKLLKAKNVPIRKASIGNITKKDITEAESNLVENPLLAVVLGFNVSSCEKSTSIKIITNSVIYKIIDEFEKWQSKKSKEIQEKKLASVKRPFKIKLLKNYIFRQSNPAVIGVEVLAGVLRKDYELMKEDGAVVSSVRTIQSEQKNIEKAEKGKQVAISMDGVIIGRQLKGDEVLYSNISESDFRKLKEMKEVLSEDEKQVLREIAEIKRKENSLWGV